MKIALIGYGKMGRLIETVAAERGHDKVVVVNESHAGLASEKLAETLKIADVGIDFSSADAVSRNVEACMLAGIPIVEGTTGWHKDREEVEKLVAAHNGAMIYGANFSIGVNLFYRIADYAAELLSKFPEYEAFIEEQHHSRKKDSPSGTAIKLEDIVSTKLYRDDSMNRVRIPIAVTRAGNIPGTHRLGFDGPSDQVLIQHTARNRECFAHGAVLGAEWIKDRKGFYEFADVIWEMLSAPVKPEKR
ncbi:4-hydroxy-tetrahydrodipicolinate reductase [Leptolyngbya sp. 7M]|uniref:4-hydroxy-tetrahydrodipicolinate reductase n=1 Tax=Leptolyngbya sp. 7M TaxID=2812896 RepID=UPI001B8AC499|nr:4-hydroxy-tetrahydrodipicolinate reductase [Leptolyngbya sp. 7M]QYO66891.1 4-hydroxy-tetrahydrodipicolinate reductase [Leptolyngbya sp. 7M]